MKTAVKTIERKPSLKPSLCCATATRKASRRLTQLYDDVLEPCGLRSTQAAILVELGYLTNGDQEKLLAGDAFANAFVQALSDAVVRFRDALAAGGGR